MLRRQLERGVQCVPTSSMGRLFDAVSSLLGVRHTASYEAQAAMELERRPAARPDETATAGPYRFAPVGRRDRPGAGAAGDRSTTCAAAGRRARSPPGSTGPWPELIAEVADRLRAETGIDRVALSGGVFQNVLLAPPGPGGARPARHLQVLTHRLVPPNDGGLALGQVAVAGSAARMAGRRRAGAR